METKAIRDLGLSLGAVAGVLAVVYFFILYLSGAMLFDTFYKFDFWVSIPFIIIGLIYIRKSASELRVWQGLVLGFYVTIVCAGVIAVFYYVFLYYINSEFIKDSIVSRLELIEQLISKFELEGNDKKVLELQETLKGNKALAEAGISPLDFAKDKILWHYLVGGIVSFIAAILFRK